MAHRPFRSGYDGYRDIVKDYSSRYRYSAYEGDQHPQDYDDDFSSGSLTDDELGDNK